MYTQNLVIVSTSVMYKVVPQVHTEHFFLSASKTPQLEHGQCQIHICSQSNSRCLQCSLPLVMEIPSFLDGLLLLPLTSTSPHQSDHLSSHPHYFHLLTPPLSYVLHSVAKAVTHKS